MIVNGAGMMLKLRAELDRRGINWHDESECISGDFWYVHAMYRTKWEKDGEEVSVIWGFTQHRRQDGTYTPVTALTYGWPEKLECWYRPNDKDPIPMTVSEIIEVFM